MHSNHGKKLKILFIAAEAYPLIKIGGLGDYAGSLPKAILQESFNKFIDVELRVVIPFHKQVVLENPNLKEIAHVSVPTSNGHSYGSVIQYSKGAQNFYLIKRKGNASGYDMVYNTDQKKDAKKYIFFSLACIEWMKQEEWIPNIIHANDWHTALAIKKIVCERSEQLVFEKIKTVLVIHNLPFMGAGSANEIKHYGICPSDSDLLPRWAKILPLPLGLEAADQIVTVSPSYAEELMQTEFSYELAPFFKAHQNKTTGILNGIDYEIWDPEKDGIIDSTYSISSLQKRKENKRKLLSQLNLENADDKPLLILISRLTDQKGINLVLESLHQLLEEDWSAIILGTGQKEYEIRFRDFETQHPHRLRYFNEYNNNLAHRLYASGDILLMPSIYEPCGLSQMIAMRYGCIPVARAVGGLIDSINSENSHNRDGYLFQKADAISFSTCLKMALNDYRNSKLWRAIQVRAMRKDFSWQKSANQYLELYQNMLKQ